MFLKKAAIIWSNTTNTTWSLEIILICWFAAQEIFLIIIYLENSGIYTEDRSNYAGNSALLTGINCNLK